MIIDLQRGIVARESAPYAPSQVIENTARIGRRCKEAGGLIIPVHVAVLPQRRRSIAPTGRRADGRSSGRASRGLGRVWFPRSQRSAAEVVITKHQWGAFYGTELDLQLRRRGMTTILLAGIATNFGVESTAREAWQHGL